LKFSLKMFWKVPSMSEVLELPKIALAGNPNCGKTALFNALTGSRQKVGNYPGVTVERKEGQIITASGARLNLLDLPGTYSLDARTPDEMIARDIILGRQSTETQPRLFVAVADATSLERNLGLVLELRALNKPVVLALNMMDLAHERGLKLDLEILSRELGVPIVPTVAVKKQGIAELIKLVESRLQVSGALPVEASPEWEKPNMAAIRVRFTEVDRILKLATVTPARVSVWTEKIDRIVLHPLWGSLLLVTVLAIMFQSIFAWATIPQDWIKNGLDFFGKSVGALLSEGPLRSLLVDGIIAGVGSVLVFLPQILVLFGVILVLEDSGYMARAAFLMDKVMGRVGLHGRAFIPLLSSYACAIPGIMATRTIESKRDRLTTILVAPLTTCSARLPVYTLLIAAFIPNKSVLGPLKLQGLVMLGLYLAGIFAALGMAVVFRKTILRGPKPALLMELPTYKWPSFQNIAHGLWERTQLFLVRAGTVILTASVLLWFLASYPKPPAGAVVNEAHSAITYSYAGKLGTTIEPLLRPIGFDWKISVALIPGFAARETMISALGTVYAVEGQEDHVAEALGQKIAKDWSMATALSLLVWYVLACQCLSTLAVTRRETNSLRWPVFMFVYMTALAYGASFVTYHAARWFGL
jgi:ferrous iron transport protein B